MDICKCGNEIRANNYNALQCEICEEEQYAQDLENQAALLDQDVPAWQERAERFRSRVAMYPIS